MLALLRNRHQLALLQENPDAVPSAVDEFLRYDVPSQATGRTTLEPITLHGVEIPAQVPVYLLLGSANRDPDRFERADRLDLRRRNNRHLGFGSGPHACLGARLARAELQVVFRELLTRTTDLRPVTRQLRWKQRIFLRGLESLRVSFRPRSGLH